MSDLDFRKRLRQLREKAGLTQSQLEKASGLTATLVSHYENGTRSPGLGNIKALISGLGCSANDLLGVQPAGKSQPEGDGWMLAETHKGMRISAEGVLGRVRGQLKFGAQEMLKHLEAMAEAFYSGNVKAVDQFLQTWDLDEKRPQPAAEQAGRISSPSPDPEYLGTTWRDMKRLDTKPSWDAHDWPQIFNDGDGHWFGVRDGWDLKAHISDGWKGRRASLLRGDGAFLCYGAHPDWENSLEQRPQQEGN